MGYLRDVPDLRTQPVRDIIFERLRKAIVQGELKPDTYFTDVEIAEEFGVSRTPVREAVQKLELGGYIERVPMRGNRVLGLSPRELAHSFAIRKALEMLALRYTALRISEDDLARMEDILDRLEAFAASGRAQTDPEQLFALVKEYNAVLFRSCGSEHLEGLVYAQREVFDRYGVMRVVLPNRVDRSVSRRRQLWEAFRARDPDRAATIWSEHLDESFEIWRDKSGYWEELKDFPFF